VPSVVIFKGVRKAKWSDRDLRIRLLVAMNAEVRLLKKEYALTTSTWEHKPKFEAIEGFKPSGPEVLVGTDDTIYKYVDEGTKRHVIMAGVFTGKSNKRTLAFHEGYKAKTIPNVIGSFSGGSYGKKVFPRMVLHPGTKARNFTKILQKRHQALFQKAMQDVLTKWAKEDAVENQ
jgi:hypothetical protein